MLDLIVGLFDTGGFVPRKECGAWTPELMWLHVGGDLFVWLAYLSIPLVLLYFTSRRNLPYSRLFVLSALFILACGFGHLIEALMFRYPLYRLAGAVKVLTAVVSWGTVLALIPVVPRVVDALEAANRPPGAGGPGGSAPHPATASARRERLLDYIVAILAGVLALLLRAAVDPLVETDHMYVLSLLAVVFVSWQGGFGPGVVTLLVGMTGMVYFFLPPRYTFVVTGMSNQLATAMFFFCGVCCAGLGEAQRQARRRTKAALAVALERKAELEVEVARRRAAEEAIRESEGRFRGMADSAPALIWLSDLDRRRTYFNKTWLEFTGRAVEQELGEGWAENVHPDDRERYLGAWAAAFAAREPFEVEYRLRRHDGVYRWVLARGTPRFTPAGEFAGFVGFCLDVTERREANDAVRRSERNLSDFFENANVGLHWVARDGTVLRVNRAELEMLGYDREEYVGRPITDFHADPEAIRDMLERLGRGERLDNYAARLRCKDGSTRDVLVSSTALWKDGRLVHSRCFTRDVTELKRAEEHLRASEERYRTLTEAIPQIIWNAGPDGEISYFNRRWLDYTDLPAEAARGGGWMRAVHPDDRERVHASWRATVGSGGDGRAGRFTEELRLMRSGGEYRWFLSVAVPLHRPDGGVDQWIGAMADIHDQKTAAETLERTVRERTAALVDEIEERKRAEQQVREVATELARSNDELEKFAYVASHDLQEPLRKIQAFGDRLRNACRDKLSDTGQEYLDRMLISADRMRRLIDDLLTFSRVTTQARPFVRLNLEKLVGEVVSDLSERIEPAGGTVRVGELPEIEADPTQMRQLFQNLIANAVKFHRPGAPPVVEVRGELVGPPADAGGGAGPACRVTVRDNGIGFDEKYLDRIFQVFQRLHGRDEYEGTGVGLALCRKIAERHGGSITARSRVGEGSAFVVTLPLRQAPQTESRPPRPDG